MPEILLTHQIAIPFLNENFKTDHFQSWIVMIAANRDNPAPCRSVSGYPPHPLPLYPRCFMTAALDLAEWRVANARAPAGRAP
jgi:hypothetical protein